MAAVSSDDAWAVGYHYDGTADQTLVLHWNGRAWRVQKSRDPGGPSNDNFLTQVAAMSAGEAWAVGYYNNGTAYQTLVLHWNGKAWRVQKSPDVGGSNTYNFLEGAGAISSKEVWAVGYYYNGTHYRTLIERGDGKAWKG